MNLPDSNTAPWEKVEGSFELGCHSEYGKLNAVVVGSVEDFAYPAFNRNVRYLTGPVKDLLSSAKGDAVNVREAAPEIWSALHDDVERVVEVFESNGVHVERPRRFHELELGYLSELQGGHSLLYPADPTFVLGKHVLELCIRRPFRRKETWATRDVLMPLIEADPEARHVSVPRAEPGRAGEEGPGPFLEGGDIIMLGDQVLCGNTDLTSNAAGSAWLARYLQPFGYTVHPVPVHGTWLHLLGVLAVLREGLAIAHLPALGGALPAPIADWEVIEIDESEARMLATVGMNLDSRRHIVDRRLTRLIDRLDDHGMEPVPVEIDMLAQWGGAVRCITLPISREAE